MPAWNLVPDLVQFSSDATGSYIGCNNKQTDAQINFNKTHKDISTILYIQDGRRSSGYAQITVILNVHQSDLRAPTLSSRPNRRPVLQT